MVKEGASNITTSLNKALEQNVVDQTKAQLREMVNPYNSCCDVEIVNARGRADILMINPSIKGLEKESRQIIFNKEQILNKSGIIESQAEPNTIGHASTVQIRAI